MKNLGHNKYKLSIVTPNYNYGKYIGHTIASVIEQDYSNVEYIIVDDGSTDNSVEIIKSYAEKYPSRIKLIQQENKGQTVAINVGLKNISGDIVGWINSDDTLCKNSLSEIMQIFKINKDVEIVIGNICVINSKGEYVKTVKYLPFDYASGVFNGFGKLLSSNAVFWRKQVMDETGLLNARFKYAMDSEYWSRLLLKRNIYNVDLDIANFRWHPQAKTIIRQNKDDIAFIEAKEEDKIIKKNSYKNLPISKYLPYRFSFILKFIYKIKRHLFKFFAGHYF